MILNCPDPRECKVNENSKHEYILEKRNQNFKKTKKRRKVRKITIGENLEQ